MKTCFSCSKTDETVSIRKMPVELVSLNEDVFEYVCDSCYKEQEDIANDIIISSYKKNDEV